VLSRIDRNPIQPVTLVFLEIEACCDFICIGIIPTGKAEIEPPILPTLEGFDHPNKHQGFQSHTPVVRVDGQDLEGGTPIWLDVDGDGVRIEDPSGNQIWIRAAREVSISA
jgi:hypothetical protein